MKSRLEAPAREGEKEGGSEGERREGMKGCSYCPSAPASPRLGTPVKEIQWRVPDLRGLLLSSLTAGLPLLPALKGSCEGKQANKK